MTYVAITQLDGSFAGTLDDILEQLEINGVALAECEFYEVGKKVSVKFVVED